VSGDTSGLSVRGADLDRARPPRWAWRDRLVLGYLNLLLGAEGVGKGTLVVWLVAQLTRGRLPGDLDGQPVGVGILGDEDGFDDVWTPRLHAAGADLARVRQIERPDGGFVQLREDRAKLADVATNEGLRVLFLDSLLDNLGVGVDDWRGKAVRDALQPARQLGRDLDLAVIGCLHPNKHGETFRQLVSGSAAFNAVSRSSLLLAEHPEDDTRRVLIRGKGNLSAKPPAVEFEIVSHRFDANGHTFNVPLARSFATSELKIDDLLAPPATREVSKVNDAAELIETLLPHDEDWHPVKDIYTAAAGEGIDDRTMQRAKQRLGVLHRRTPTFPAAFEWSWPTTADASQDTSGPSVFTDATVVTVATGNSPNTTVIPSDDTDDTDDSENKRVTGVTTSQNGHDALTGYTLADLEALAAEHSEATR